MLSFLGIFELGIRFPFPLGKSLVAQHRQAWPEESELTPATAAAPPPPAAPAESSASSAAVPWSEAVPSAQVTEAVECGESNKESVECHGLDVHICAVHA